MSNPNEVKVQRYSDQSDSCDSIGFDSDGEFVKYSDYQLLEQRVADCESGIYQNRIVKIVSQRNGELELENKRLIEAINVAIERINDGRNNDMTIGFLEQALEGGKE